MKFKPWTNVIVTEVPEVALDLVRVGQPAVVLPLEEPYASAAADFEMVLVRINGYSYWWREEDLELPQ